MTLNEIIVMALTQLGRGQDTRTIEGVRAVFTLFANEAQLDIASTIKVIRAEKYRINGTTVDITGFERPCIKLVAVTQDGFPVRFSMSEASGIAFASATGLVDVTYRYVPDAMENLCDTPDLPAYLHALIVNYVVARARMAGGVDTQRGFDAYMQLYEAEKARMVSSKSSGGVIENAY